VTHPCSADCIDPTHDAEYDDIEIAEMLRHAKRLVELGRRLSRIQSCDHKLSYWDDGMTTECVKCHRRWWAGT
jgi:hypothetical protein